MAWRYKFDDGPEKPLACESTLYAVAAMSAFGQEKIEKMPTITSPGIFPYEGHVLTLWDDRLVPTYGPYKYGIGFNECGSLIVPIVAVLARCKSCINNGDYDARRRRT